MGIVIGIIIIPIGLIIPGWKNYFKVMMLTFSCACVTALLTGIIALIYGLSNYSATNLPRFNVPNEVVDKISFCVVGNMHNLSYIGGLLGIFVGVVFIIVANFRVRKMI
jgi:hypothetical protein